MGCPKNFPFGEDKRGKITPKIQCWNILQNESRKGRLCPGESRIKEKHWDANQEKTLQTNVYTHPQNWSE